MGETIFSKIIRKEIPAEIVFENDKILAFKDVRPQAPVHILIIPKTDDIPTLKEIDVKKHSDLIVEMIGVANVIAQDMGISDSGYRLVINCGANAGQEVYHLHMHLLGGRKMSWPPG